MTALEQLARLEAVAKRATPGPWSWEGNETKAGTRYQHVLAVGMGNPSIGRGICNTYHSDAIGPVLLGNGYETIPPREGKREDAEYIAAFDPPTSLRLLSALRIAMEGLELIESNPREGSVSPMTRIFCREIQTRIQEALNGV